MKISNLYNNLHDALIIANNTVLDSKLSKLVLSEIHADLLKKKSHKDIYSTYQFTTVIGDSITNIANITGIDNVSFCSAVLCACIDKELKKSEPLPEQLQDLRPSHNDPHYVKEGWQMGMYEKEISNSLGQGPALKVYAKTMREAENLAKILCEKLKS